jgi:hypothetical protein
MKTKGARLLGIAIFLVVVTAIGTEALLRLFPSAIPTQLLRRFDDDLRIEIAHRLGMPTRLSFRELPRDDGGPPFHISLPHTPFPLSDPHLASKIQVMDGRGFCNSDSLGEPPFDVVTVGGSISWCVGVSAEDTWTARIGAGARLRAYNLSVPGVGPYEYLQLLAQFGVAFKPRLIFFDYSAGNDLRDVIAFDRYRVGSPAIADEGGQSVLRSRRGGGFLARHSYLIGLLQAAFGTRDDAASGGRERLPRAGELPEKDAIDFRYELRFGDRTIAFNAENRDRDEALYAIALARGVIDVDTLRLPIERLALLARRQGIAVAVTFTPAAYTTYRTFVRFDDKALGDVMWRFHERQRDAVAAAAVEFGLPFIDLTPPLQAAAAELQDRELLYFDDNLHLTVGGHRVIAEFLTRQIPTLMPR